MLRISRYLFVLGARRPIKRAANEDLEQEARDIENHADTKVPHISTEHDQTESAFKTRK